VGRRTHRSYFRIYDKGVEKRVAPPGVLWRVELEAKQSHAEKLCQQNLAQLKDPTFCAHYCVRSLISLGCSWPFAPFSDEQLDISTGRTTQTTPTRLAAWLCQSVTPVIRRLRTVYTVGELLQMLELSDVAVSTEKEYVRG